MRGCPPCRSSPATRAIVTGASRGIGRATAQRAGRARRHGRPRLARRRGPRRRWRPSSGDRAIALAADVADREAIERAVERFAERAGGLDLLVANAGVAHYAPVRRQRARGRRGDGPHQRARHDQHGPRGAPPMLDRARGHIVVVCSGAGLRAFPWAAVYGGDQGRRTRLRRGAAPRALGHRRRADHRLPGRGRRPSSTPTAEQLPDWRNSDDAIARRGGRRPRCSRPSRRTAARSTCRAQVQAARPQRARPRPRRPAAGRTARRLRGAAALLRVRRRPGSRRPPRRRRRPSRPR